MQTINLTELTELTEHSEGNITLNKKEEEQIERPILRRGYHFERDWCFETFRQIEQEQIKQEEIFTTTIWTMNTFMNMNDDQIQWPEECAEEWPEEWTKEEEKEEESKLLEELIQECKQEKEEYAKLKVAQEPMEHRRR
jgi:hypothetical protein